MILDLLLLLGAVVLLLSLLHQLIWRRRSFIMDWLKAIYNVVGAPYPMLTQVMAFLVGAVVFGGAWWLIGYEYRKDHPGLVAAITKHDPAPAPITPQGKETPMEEKKPESKADIPKVEAGPGSVVSVNQQGGITAKTVNIQPIIASPRWGLNEDHLRRLVNRMAPYAPSQDRGDLITCMLNDADSTRFALNLVAAFRSAGWTLGGSGYNQAVMMPPPTGIVVVLHSRESNPPGFLEFINTLREAGIEPIGNLDDHVPENNFKIIVGMKP
jgi:hypothetical protein